MDAPLPVLLSHPQPKEDPGPEFYEDNSEECLNYNIDKENEKINKAMFDDLGLNKEDEQSNIIEFFISTLLSSSAWQINIVERSSRTLPIVFALFRITKTSTSELLNSISSANSLSLIEFGNLPKGAA